LQVVCDVPTVCLLYAGKHACHPDNLDAYKRAPALSRAEITKHECRVPMHTLSGGFDANAYTGK
jgi:hypothetical protein